MDVTEALARLRARAARLRELAELAEQIEEDVLDIETSPEGGA